MASDEAEQQIDFVTLGMYITDEIYPPTDAEDQTPRLNIIGGAGTYSAIGARLCSPPPKSRSVGWIVDAGTDFPDQLREVIKSWDTGVLLRERNGLTTRGWNGYSGNDHRAFKYLTPKLRLTADDLTPALLKSMSFHLICAPLRCMESIQRVLARRSEAFRDDEPRPLFIWEPVPDLCTPAEMENTIEALKYVDVISPNHEELAALFGYIHASGVDMAVVEQYASHLLKHGIGPHGSGAVVVRCGKEGCYVATREITKWLPAYHTSQGKVVDPTGGGNGFLGGLAAGLVQTDGKVVEAAKWGTVAASFCIEQVGMPQLNGPTVEEGEEWNGVNVQRRLEEYRERLHPSSTARHMRRETTPRFAA